MISTRKLGARIPLVALFGALAGGSPAMAQCPATTCTMGDCDLTQSFDTSANSNNSVACGVTGGGTTPNGWARCYDLAAEGVPPGDFTVESVTFGVQQASMDGINVNVNLYLDTDGCPPLEPGMDAMLLATEAIVVNMADEGTFITVAFPGAPVVPDGTDLVVEIEQVDDGTGMPEFAFRPISNDAGQCEASYIRAADCNLPGWADLAAIGFPDAHLVQVVTGSVDLGKPTCEGDVNGDGQVDVRDLLELLAAFGDCPDPPAPCPADLNGDGRVNVRDLLIVLINFGPCVPEPCDRRSDCDDGDPCTFDLCIAGECYHFQIPGCP